MQSDDSHSRNRHTRKVVAALSRAFPLRLMSAVADAADCLGDHDLGVSAHLIQETPRGRWGSIVVDDDVLEIPSRQYYAQLADAAYPAAEGVLQAWLTRSHDGYVRQRALAWLLDRPERWHVPFVVQLCGEYVAEICVEVVNYASEALGRDQRMLNAYASFWRTNPNFVALTRARAISYWAEYGRGLRLDEWPGVVALNLIESQVS